MSSWMKRRIHRSRSRCQKVLLANKERMRHDKSREKLDKPSTTNFRVDANQADDK